MKRYIQLVTKNGLIAETAGHAAVLTKYGYEVKVHQDRLIIEAKGVRTGLIDLSTPEKAKAELRSLILAKEVYDYNTSFTWLDGVTYHCRPVEGRRGAAIALDVIGAISAFVTKGDETVKAPSTKRSLGAEILGDLGL